MIQFQKLTKTYGDRTAVNGISAEISPGKVTGFLGPNGAGKSTTMRMIVGLDRPTSGTVLVNGKPYGEFQAPLHEVGVLLDAKAIHTGRTAYNHLRAMAATHGIGTKRVREVIELAGLQSVADKRVGGFSLGMGQRLGIAAALLGDPATLIFDEPVNGLDPEGVMWIRQLMRSLADEGRTVFLSSHLMSEMAQTADHIIVLGRGRILADAPVEDLIATASGPAVRVRTPSVETLAQILTSPDVGVTCLDEGLLEITGLDTSQVAEIASRAGVVLHELSPVSASLEDAYLALTADAVEYQSGTAR